MQVTDYDPDGTISCEFLGRCDYKDNNIESMYVRFDHGKIIAQKPFIIESVKYPSGELCEMVYENDAKGWPIEETILDLMGNVFLKVMIKRDEKENVSECKFSDGSFYKYKYDDHGNRVEWISHTASGNNIITAWTYDSNGNLIEENINDFFKTAYKYHYEHNTFKYVFDKNGNWIERIDFEHDIPQRIVIRTIDYSKSL
jgi:YD repeat-containing protein